LRYHLDVADRCVIVVSEPLSSDALARLRAAGEVVELAACDEPTIAAAVGEADALVVRTASRVTRRVIDAGSRLRVIGRAGVGLDNIDVAYAKQRGITVVYTPAASTQAVAELTIGLMLAAVRRIAAYDARVRAGEFAEMRRAATGYELAGRTLGVVGMGRIGKTVAKIAHAGLGMNVVYNDIIDVAPLPVPARELDKPALYAAADIVSLHVPLTPLTERLIDAAALAQFRPGAYLINTARGSIVDAVAVAAALHAGRLAGAAFDVFDVEPPPPDHPLRAAPNCVLSPHAASRTPAGIASMDSVVDDVIAVLQGRPPRFPAE
jgi:D-3-phosphoglycerate dehydrogenase